MTLTEIDEQLGTSLAANDDILSYIKSDDKKIHYDPGRELFSLKTSYPTIINRTTFMEYFVKAVQGIPEDSDLWDCYSGIKEDIDELKKADKVRSIFNQDSKRYVLFYRDTEDRVEHTPKLDQYLIDMWTDLPRHDSRDLDILGKKN